MWIVIMVHNFDADAPAVVFPSNKYNKAKAYLHWLWEDYLNTEIAQGSELNEEECDHEEEYARVTWVDGSMTEFILTHTSDPEPGFAEVDWKRYV